MRKLFVLAVLGLAACVESVPQPATSVAPLPASGAPVTQAVAEQNFASVVSRMEPVIERECLNRIGNSSCDFRIVVDNRPGQPPNAYQTLGKDGRPVIAFTLPLIAEARNTDELAFVMGHEAAHHIGEHIPRQQESAKAGALILGTLTAVSGGDARAIRSAQDIGGVLGARRYAKEYELEADALGTVLSWKAGYDPERGAAFFTRIPDPGNQFLGTHPPNASRIETVRRTLSGLR